jgi:hypothetical protein
MSDEVTYAIYYAGRFVKRFKTHEEALAFGIDRYGNGSKNWENGWKITEMIE